jgi:4-hydroxy-4-methyl-2-oxoglutarate aldolase
MYLIHPRVQGVDQELRDSYAGTDSYAGIDTSTLGHLTDFGYVRGLQPLVRPLRLLGNALTVRIPHVDGSIIREALIQSQPGDVLVIDMSGDSERACWGELRQLAALHKGLAGVVVDGCVTDVRALKELGLPVFSRGISSLTTRSLKLEGELNRPVSIGGVAVCPGDLVVGDDDGLFILNADLARELSFAAHDKQARDAQRRQELALPRALDISS